MDSVIDFEGMTDLANAHGSTVAVQRKYCNNFDHLGRWRRRYGHGKFASGRTDLSRLMTIGLSNSFFKGFQLEPPP
jgi:DNA-binding winged helix-turn-helix (wHTH) protein